MSPSADGRSLVGSWGIYYVFWLLLAVLIAGAIASLPRSTAPTTADRRPQEGGRRKAPTARAEPPADREGRQGRRRDRSADARCRHRGLSGGQTEQAIRAFDAALRGGGLTNQQIARALYYRGLVLPQEGQAGARHLRSDQRRLAQGRSVCAEKQEAMSTARRGLSARRASPTCRRWRSREPSPEAPRRPRWAGSRRRHGSATPSAPTAATAPHLGTCRYAANRDVLAAAAASGGDPDVELQRRRRRLLQQHHQHVRRRLVQLELQPDAVTTASIATAAPWPTNWSETTPYRHGAARRRSRESAAAPTPAPARAPAAPAHPPPSPRPSPPQTQVVAVAPPPAAQSARRRRRRRGKFHVQVAAVRSRSEAYALCRPPPLAARQRARRRASPRWTKPSSAAWARSIA